MEEKTILTPSDPEPETHKVLAKIFPKAEVTDETAPKLIVEPYNALQAETAVHAQLRAYIKGIL